MEKGHSRMKEGGSGIVSRRRVREEPQGSHPRRGPQEGQGRQQSLKSSLRGQIGAHVGAILQRLERRRGPAPEKWLDLEATTPVRQAEEQSLNSGGSEALWVQKTRTMEVVRRPGGEKGTAPVIKTTETQVMIPYRTDGGQHGVVSLSISLARIDLDGLAEAPRGENNQHIRQSMAQAELPSEWVEALAQDPSQAGTPPWEELVKQAVAPYLEGTTPNFAQWQGVECAEGRIDRRLHGEETQILGKDLLTELMGASHLNIHSRCVLAHDVGVLEDGGKFVSVLKQGTPYPSRESRLFATARDHTPEISIRVAQKVGAGEDDLVSLGTFTLQMDAVRRKSSSHIEVVFALNAGGALTVTAMDLDSGATGSLQIPKNRVQGSNGQEGTGHACPWPSGTQEEPMPVWGPSEGESLCQEHLRNLCP